MAVTPRHGISFVLVTIVIDSMGLGIVMPVLPRLIMDVDETGISHATAVGGWMTLAYALTQFAFSPLVGNLSDHVGRRPVLLLALLGLMADYLLMGVAETLELLFLARVLAGLFGGTYGTCQAALADITAPDERARVFGFVGAAFGIGFILGPAIGGLLGEFGPRAPFHVAAGLAGINLLYGFLVFPDTLRPENRRPFSWRRANPLGAWASMRALPGMTRAALVLVLWQIANLVYALTWSFFAIARLGWSNAMIGLSLAAVGIIMALCQVFLTGRVVRRFGERGAAQIGLVSAIAGFIGYALVDRTWVAFALMGAIALQTLVQPSLMAILSRRATPETHGEVQGISAMAMGLGSIVAPVLFNPAMAYFTSPAAPFRFTGVAFVIAAGMAMLAFLALLRLPRAQIPPGTGG